MLQSEIIPVVQGLLRTNDFETVTQCLSFVNVIGQQVTVMKLTAELVGKSKHQCLILENFVTPRLLILILSMVSKQPERAEIVFVHYSLEIVSKCLPNSTLREIILSTELPGMVAI